LKFDLMVNDAKDSTPSVTDIETKPVPSNLSKYCSSDFSLSFTDTSVNK